MCGLAGIFCRTEAEPIDQAVLHRMTLALQHRGPDGEGFHVEPGLGLGHRRLSIIDIASGYQPMYNEDRSVVIVFNGEIYGHAALRTTLQQAGHVFASRCDTEVILHAWESWGPDCLQHLSGMFAFALWDRNRRQLFLARDRLGKKPLYYAWTDDGRFVFASELSGLAAVPGLRRRVSPTAVEDFFTYGYIPDPHSIYQGIRKLPAAHCLLLEPGGHERLPQRYWSMQAQPSPMGEGEAAAALVERLTRSTEARLIADVPLGAFLSGGVDSSTVVALAAGLRAQPLSTFTIGFPGAEDERPYAETVARRYGTTQHDDTTTVDYIAAARDQARVFGEPFGDPSSVPTYHVCALTRRHVTVALSGDGGDEVLAGYRRYQWHSLAEAVRRFLPPSVRHRVIREVARIYPKLDRAPRWLRAKHTLTEISLDSALGYFRTVCKVHHERRRALFSPEMERCLDGYDPALRIASLMEECATDDGLRQAQYVDLNTYLPGDILTKVDRTSMANSLEVRAPMLDHEFVQWALSLPASLKLRRGQGKYLLKRAMTPYLPHDILWRSKQGFATPLADQFRRGAARLRERLLGDAMLDSGLFQPDALAQLIDEHEAARFDHSGPLWLLLAFEGFLVAESSDPQRADRFGQPEGVGA
jgi:asparagine synthase (glutamine-hydrolysing)